MPTASASAMSAEPLAAAGQCAEVQEGRAAGLPAGVIGQAEHGEQDDRRLTGPASRLWNSIAISCLPPNAFDGALRVRRCCGRKTQMLGPGKTSSNFLKSITRARRSSWRSMPTQCGTFSGACSSKSSVVTE